MFTRASRLRMLRFLATIRWTGYKRSCFVTLTYPWQREKRNAHTRAQDRQLFLRRCEEVHGKQITGIWRTEWQIRKSGPTAGQVAPHHHMIFLGVRYIPYKEINDAWKGVIHWEGYCRTEILQLKGEKQAGYYVAKYCAKTDEGSLVNDAYPGAIDGRHWGVIRKPLLDRYPETVLENSTPEQIAYCQLLARIVWPSNDIRPDESFSLMASGLHKKLRVLRSLGIDGDGEIG